MNYYLFLDESGDHGLKKVDPDFPAFVLCGIIMSDLNYESLRSDFNSIKQKFWGDNKVIFHSRDIRKCDKEFKVLLDIETKRRFYTELDRTILESNYTVISSVIEKVNYIKKYGKLRGDVYEIALSFIIERAVFFLDSLNEKINTLYLIIEKRGKKEDAQLKQHIETLIKIGTYYVSPDRLKAYNVKVEFREKRQNVNGLQLSDLIAYPIARYCMDKERANPAFEIIKSKIYSKGGKMYGLKIFP
jgi:hypothetical protein